MTNDKQDVLHYETTYNGKEALKKYSPGEAGIWQIRGEGDENGYNRPLLGYFAGRFSDVLNLAVTLDGFWNYGSGGSILKIHYVAVDHKTTAKRQHLLNKQAKLQLEMAEIERQLSEWS